jgi:hypothetical protein
LRDYRYPGVSDYGTPKARWRTGRSSFNTCACFQSPPAGRVAFYTRKQGRHRVVRDVLRETRTYCVPKTRGGTGRAPIPMDMGRIPRRWRQLGRPQPTQRGAILRAERRMPFFVASRRTQSPLGRPCGWFPCLHPVRRVGEVMSAKYRDCLLLSSQVQRRRMWWESVCVDALDAWSTVSSMGSLAGKRSSTALAW